MYRSIIGKMRPDENLGWCKPYESDDRRVRFTLMEGKIATMLVNKMRVENPNTEEIHYAAMTLAGDDIHAIKDHFSDDMDFLLHRCSEVGCTFCPFNKDCDAVHEHIEYRIYKGTMEVSPFDLRKKYIPDTVTTADLYKVYAEKQPTADMVGAYETYEMAHKAAKLLFDTKCETVRKDGYTMPLLDADFVLIESYNLTTDEYDDEISETFIHGYTKVYPDEGEEEA